MKFNLEYDRDLQWICKEDDFSPDAWFYFESFYDGSPEYWILKDNGDSTYCVPFIFSPPGEYEPQSWRIVDNENYVFKSFDAAAARIPGACKPLFEDARVRPPRSSDISRFRIYNYNIVEEYCDYEEETFNMGHAFITHDFYDNEKNKHVWFSDEEILEDTRLYLGLTELEIKWISGRYRRIHERSGEYSSVCFNSGHLRGRHIRTNEKILLKLKRKFAEYG